MSIKKLSLVMFLSCCSVTAMAAPATEHAATVSKPQTSPIKKIDGEIIKVLITVNWGEVAAGKIALKKSDNASVKEFAQKMVTDHSQNMKNLENLAQKLDTFPQESAKSQALSKQNDALLNKLGSLKNSQFNVAYMDAMVKGHADALKVIDDLLSKVKNPQLKAFLKTTRDAVAHHLELAKQVRSHLSSKH